MVIILSAIIFQVSGQEATKENLEKNQSAVAADTNKNIKVVVGENLASFENRRDAMKMRFGNRGVSILESLEGHKCAFEKFTEKNSSKSLENKDEKDGRTPKKPRFRGHWAGVEFGFNNYLTSGNSMTMPDDISYMNLHSGKSNSFNFNFSQLSFGFTRNIGIVTGLGINWNNYRFDGNFNIQKGPDGKIDSISPVRSLKKSKLATVYLTLPILLELQAPVENHNLHVSAGFIGAIKLGSHSRMIYEGGDDNKSYSDFNLNLLRYGATARIGYQHFQFYGTYYMTPLFETAKGPGGYDLFPFEIGFSFTFKD